MPRQTRRSARGRVEGPGREDQRERLTPSLTRLTTAFRQQRLRLAAEPEALEPEQVLVIEVAGEIADFMRAVGRIPGLEWLAEQTETQLEPDDEFAVVDRDGERRAYSRQLFIMASDVAAWRQLLSLWRLYRRGEPFPYGLAKFRDMFDQLRDL